MQLYPLFALSLVPAAASYLASATAVPRPWSPLPFVELVLSRWLSTSAIAGVAAISFIAVNFTRQPDRPGIRLRFPVFMAVGTALTVVFFAMSLREGLTRYGSVHTVSVLAVNSVLIGTFWYLWRRWRQTASRAQSLTVGLIVHCWLFWCAFPYLFEGM